MLLFCESGDILSRRLKKQLKAIGNPALNTKTYFLSRKYKTLYWISQTECSANSEENLGARQDDDDKLMMETFEIFHMFLGVASMSLGYLPFSFADFDPSNDGVCKRNKL